MLKWYNVIKIGSGRMKNIKNILSLVLIICAVFFMTGCSKNENELVLATEAGFAPYEYYEDGEVVGVDIDIAKEIWPINSDSKSDTLAGSGYSLSGEAIIKSLKNPSKSSPAKSKSEHFEYAPRLQL